MENELISKENLRDLKKNIKNNEQENVITERVDHLIEHRFPWLFLGLLGGLLVTLLVSKYEVILEADVRLAFFIPIVVYLSAAVGVQTQTIYIRALVNKKKINIRKYLFKEVLVGLGLGILSGTIVGCLVAFWLKSSILGLTIGLTMLTNITLAPILAVFVPSLLYRRHTDPALGSGPVEAIIQDFISLLVYFLIASIFIL